MSWTFLPLPASAAVDLPPLLISATFLKDTYTVHLTDLSHIWSESLDRKAIIRHSRLENTSIDPSSSPDQFAILLRKIKLGLAGEDGTLCTLTIGSEEEQPSLELNISVDLPGGLAPLEWTMRLSASRDGSIKSHLIVPLLQTQHIQRREISGLGEVIRDKDHVIQKLLDKLESMGTDLGQVFAQAAGRPGRKGDWNRDRVKGMAVFDYSQWRQDLSSDCPQDISDLLKATFNDNKDETTGVVAPQQVERGEEERWWRSIGGLTINLSNGRVSTNKGSMKSKQSSKITVGQGSRGASDTHENISVGRKLETPVMEDKAFEPLPSSHKTGEETEDDDDLDVQGRTTRESKSPLPIPRTKKILGKIGGKKRTASPQPPERAESFVEKHETGAKTTSEDTESDVQPSEATSKPRKKLGQVGGKKKREATPLPDSTVEQDREASQAPETPKKRLGIIGHKKETPKKEEQEEEPSRGRQSTKPDGTVTPLPRETSDERADRKRELLKKELEQKAKAPVKKKRKL